MPSSKTYELLLVLTEGVYNLYQFTSTVKPVAVAFLNSHC